MRGWPTLLLAALAALPGCEQQTPLPAPAPQPLEARPAKQPNRDALHAELRPWLTRQDDAPKKLQRVECPDDAIAKDAPSDDERTLVLRAQDSRWEKRSLLPLRVTRELASVDAPALEARLIATDAPLPPGTESQIEWLSKRRYVGAFHVLDYSGPHVIHRLGHAKPEWVAGWMLAYLVVHEAETGRALCSVQIHVKNDVSEAPLTKRRRSDVTDSLSSDLGKKLRDEAPAALGSISKVLLLEAPKLALAP
jgi:hypothetical protein